MVVSWARLDGRSHPGTMGTKYVAVYGEGGGGNLYLDREYIACIEYSCNRMENVACYM